MTVPAGAALGCGGSGTNGGGDTGGNENVVGANDTGAAVGVGSEAGEPVVTRQGDAGGGLDAAAGDPTYRYKVQLKDGWRFIASETLTGAEVVGFDDSKWTTVSVPHTWDSVRGVAQHASSWYRTHFDLPREDIEHRVYLDFEGVFQTATVYVNGKLLGEHRGGYTGFVVDATAAVKLGGDNELAVKVANVACADCLPDGTPRLWKGYGGIYRKAWVLETNKFHVATTDHASTGVYITPSNVSPASANISIKTMVTNDEAVAKMLTVKTALIDARGDAVLTLQSDVLAAAGATTPVTQKGMVSHPNLWAPNQPYLYTVRTTILADGAVTDVVDEHTGFRSYSLSANDFLLNGVSTRLRGVCKQQESESSATAMSDAEIVTDWDHLQLLGVNYVRLGCFPRARLEYDLADQRGIMVWAENGHTNNGAPTPNGVDITREMVYQNYNHPSIIFWSAGNEAPGVAATSEYASVIHGADPSRPVVYAGNGQSPSNVDLLFHNTYAGWYGGSIYDFISGGDHWISETGGGMSIATHTPDSFAMNHSVDSFEPEEYGTLLNEVRFDDLFRKPSHVAAYSAWVFRDVSDNKYKGALNTKGLETFAGYPKDLFYHYQSFLRKDPVVHILGRHYFLRSADPRGQGPIKVYSNAATIHLTVNDVDRGSVSNGQYTHPNATPIQNVFYWPDALVPGKNVVVATDGVGHSDTVAVYYKGTGNTLPADAAAKVQNLTSTNGAAYFIDVPVADQQPFYYDFDGHGDNTFDAVPAAVGGAGWIATKRQSNAAETTSMGFDLSKDVDVYLMATVQAAAPPWVTSAGFVDTGTLGKWRDDTLKLVDFRLFKRTVAAGSHISLAPSPGDYVVLIR